MNKKRILILANSTVGLYRFRKELLTHLNKNEDVSVSVPYDGFENEIKAIGVEVIETNIDRRGINPIKDILLFFNYLWLIKKKKPDVILTYTVKPNIYGNIAAALLRRPVVSTVTGLGDAFMRAGFSGKITRLLYKISFTFAKTIAFQNQDDYLYMKELGIVKKQNIVHVPGSGVNLEEYMYQPYPEESEKIKFLFIGRLMKSKGIYELVEATKKLAKSSPIPFELLLLGDADEDIEPLLTEIKKSQEVMTVLGFQKDVQRYVKQASVTILPSYREGTSNVLLESAASGRPLITTNVSGCKEIVDDGISGFVCEVKDTQSLYDAMQKMLTLTYQERLRMGQNARHKVEAQFDRNIVIVKMEQAIQALIETH